ncbi:LLM class flavin-dependent oxidoreductase [Actinophytocola sp.]|uniref:LLM class flavin-dependent oxidoreductase n=1 Tax=Actinophytocola sp. TaxID=1872138 RepID=UPI003D6C639D
MELGIVLSGHTDVVAEARLAESLGLSHVAAGEHVFFTGPTSNAFVTLAAAAAATTSVRLVSTVTLLPLYPVPLAAKLAATVDRISGGRFNLGIGVGGESAAEFAACGVPVAERGARTNEALLLLEKLFTGEPITFHGRYTEVSGLALQPTPVQRPRPPVWIGGRSEAAMRRAAEHGDVWMPYMYTPDMLATSLHRIRDMTTTAGRPPVTGAVFTWLAVDHDATHARHVAEAKLAAVYRQNTDRLLDRYVPTGDPSQVAARLREYATAGADHVICALACPDNARPAMIELLAKEVWPLLRSSACPELGSDT